MAGSELPAEASSSYAAPYDKVIIVVKASDLGLEAGDTIAGFVSGVAQNAMVLGALYDQMPNSLSYANPYTLVGEAFARQYSVSSRVRPTAEPGHSMLTSRRSAWASNLAGQGRMIPSPLSTPWTHL